MNTQAVNKKEDLVLYNKYFQEMLYIRFAYNMLYDIVEISSRLPQVSVDLDFYYKKLLRYIDQYFSRIPTNLLNIVLYVPFEDLFIAKVNSNNDSKMWKKVLQELNLCRSKLLSRYSYFEWEDYHWPPFLFDDLEFFIDAQNYIKQYKPEVQSNEIKEKPASVLNKQERLKQIKNIIKIKRLGKKESIFLNLLAENMEPIETKQITRKVPTSSCSKLKQMVVAKIKGTAWSIKTIKSNGIKPSFYQLEHLLNQE